MHFGEKQIERPEAVAAPLQARQGRLEQATGSGAKFVICCCCCMPSGLGKKKSVPECLASLLGLLILQ